MLDNRTFWIIMILVNVAIMVTWTIPIAFLFFAMIITIPIALLVVYLQYKALRYCISKYNECNKT